MEKLIKATPQGATYKHNQPFKAKVLEIKNINNRTLDAVVHIELDIKGSGIEYLEGQSVGVIAPGKRADGRPNKIRLYSIASKRGSKKLSLTVKKLVYELEGKQYFGLCSSYLCGLAAGDYVLITGPTGRAMLPPQDKQTDLILVGTGTGVAPFLGFFKNFVSYGWGGEIMLFMGYKYQAEALYCNNLSSDLLQCANQLGIDLNIALSREQKNKAGKKLYVADLMYAKMPKLKQILKRNNFAIYICGLRGMEQAISALFKQAATELGIVWEPYLAELKKLQRYNLEVY